ncbi:hypothetical protein DPV86_03995 [Haemophilus parahaemolyticus]|uniref:Uncharacterized protein n=1 Tax=Haemophilus parahaemolyticus TaxID=735 RepID=A0A369Z6P8_HAEPH|nr:hypothetical protein [Haemophilus parahaemolyticus]RDE83070.1 hypothetical protein DPV86_03995 [Haemophilus parahaemolyticus]RDF00131.1 hypothetical protein DPV98_10020 [Haemophilus parahaemolyticus]
MSNNSNIELVKQLLQKAGVVIHPKSEGVMVYAYRNGKQYESFVCSWMGSNLTVSVSIDGKADLEKSTKIVKGIFGKQFAVRHLAGCPLDGKQANYFSCEFLN